MYHMACHVSVCHVLGCYDAMNTFSIGGDHFLTYQTKHFPVLFQKILEIVNFFLCCVGAASYSNDKQTRF